MDGFFYTHVTYATIAFLISASICGWIIQLHKKFNISAKSDKRRHHVREIPLLGGLGIILSVCVIGSFFLNKNPEFSETIDHTFILLAMVVSVAIGIFDDLYEVRARWKFLAQNIITVCLIAALWKVQSPVDSLLGQNTPGSLLVKWFWGLGLLNSINLIDGLDGLASGIGFIVVCFLSITNSVMVEYSHALLAIVAPAIMGFFVWNKYPAKIFLGECGAQFIAIVLFISCMTFSSSKITGVDAIVPLFALGIPIFDTLMAISRRAKRGVGLMSADREHIHHRLMRLGLSHPNAVRFLHGLTIYLCWIGSEFAQEKSFRMSSLVLVVAGLNINLVLLMIAENKLYSYLTKFAHHMLRAMDETSTGPIMPSQLQLDILKNSHEPYAAFQLDLSNCIQAMLEKSPGKIQLFYTNLSHTLKGEASEREVFFNSSTHVIIIQPISAWSKVEEVESKLREQLMAFEEKNKIDLYLNLRNTLTDIGEYHKKTAILAVKNRVKETG